jgi:hypothetical protein
MIILNGWISSKKERQSHSKKMVVFFKEMFFLQQMGCVPPKEWPFPWGQVC